MPDPIIPTDPILLDAIVAVDVSPLKTELDTKTTELEALAVNVDKWTAQEQADFAVKNDELEATIFKLASARRANRRASELAKKLKG